MKTAEQIERDLWEHADVDWDYLRQFASECRPFDEVRIRACTVLALLDIRDELRRRDAVPTEDDIAEAERHVRSMWSDKERRFRTFQNEIDFADHMVKRIEEDTPRNIDNLRYNRAKQIAIKRIQAADEAERIAARTPDAAGEGE